MRDLLPFWIARRQASDTKSIGGNSSRSGHAAGNTSRAWHAARAEAVLDSLGVSTDGLSSKAVRERLDRHGPNRLRPPAACTALRRLLAQFHNVLIYVLLVVVLQLLMTCSGPLQFLFDTRAIGAHEWLPIVAVAAVIFLLVKAEKAIVGRFWQREHPPRPAGRTA